MKSIIIISSLNPDLLPEGERWLVIGPHCWGRSRSLAVALHNAVIERAGYSEGTFTARVIPTGELNIDNDGSYGVKGWTPEQQERAKVSTRLVAITRQAAQRWSKEAGALLKEHTKELKP